MEISTDKIRQSLLNLNKEIKEITTIEMEQLRNKNTYSTRLGAMITVEYINKRNQKSIIKLWAKKVEKPEAAFTSINTLYQLTINAGIQDPIPKPYLYDSDTNIVVMEAISGENLRNILYKHASFIDFFHEKNIINSFYDIGKWLGQFSKVSSTGKNETLKSYILPLLEKLKSDESFNKNERKKVEKNILKILNAPISKIYFPQVKPHNDFTLRNIFINDDGFNIIDWDSMVHPCFPEETLCWWDVTCFILNIQSLLRYSPLVSKNRINNLCKVFVDGYISSNREFSSVNTNDYFDSIMYVFTLKYWLKIDTDRPLYEIYNNNLGWRYINTLKSSLTNGHSFVN
jgi:tRNA A-37 threonylcarbamoyl transferase component Bud32